MSGRLVWPQGNGLAFLQHHGCAVFRGCCTHRITYAIFNTDQGSQFASDLFTGLLPCHCIWDWNKVACQDRRAGVVTFVGAVHEQINLLILAAHYGWRPFFLSPTTVGVVQAQGLDSTSNSNTLVVDG